MFLKSTICAAAAAGLLAIAAPGAAQAAMPVNAGINTAGSGGLVQTVRWHQSHWRRWHRHHRRPAGSAAACTGVMATGW